MRGKRLLATVCVLGMFFAGIVIMVPEKAKAAIDVNLFTHSKYGSLWDQNIGPMATSIAYSPDGTKVAVGGGNGYIYLYHSTTHQLVRKWMCWSGLSKPITSIAWSPDGTLLVAVCRQDTNSTVITWNPLVCWQVGPAAPDTYYWASADYAYTTVAFTPDGRYVAAGETAVNYCQGTPASIYFLMARPPSASGQHMVWTTGHAGLTPAHGANQEIRGVVCATESTEGQSNTYHVVSCATDKKLYKWENISGR